MSQHAEVTVSQSSTDEVAAATSAAVVAAMPVQHAETSRLAATKDAGRVRYGAGSMPF